MVRRTLRIAVFTALALAAFALAPDAQAANTAREHAQWVLSRYNNGWGINLLEYTLGCGCDDGATPADNIRDAAAGRAANRSNYGTAPGGTVTLKHDLLYGMQKLKERYDHTYRVTAIAGGSHSSTSRHYAGVAFDVDRVNGQVVSFTYPHGPFQQHCRDLGATEVLGPGDAGHDTHIHCAWPRP
ncbi:MAG TPA: hypothetical protein VGD58_07445 [Herpetosiphonaceae bacterium]